MQPLLIWRFLRNARANVAVTFAIALLPMLGLVGAAVDVGRTLELKSVLDAAADAAALAAATQAQNTLRLGGTTSAAQTAGTSAGTKMFQADTLRVASVTGASPTPTVSVSTSGMTITATVAYTNIGIPTAFGRFVGMSSVPVSNSASASLTLPKYINISVAIDISQSMGLAATTAGISQLESLTVGTPDGACAFGCHVPSPGATLSNEQIAHKNGVQLRIDVIKSATQNMISTAQSQGTGLISFALYELQAGPPNPSVLFTTLSGPSTAYSALSTAAGNIDLGNNSGSVGYGDSDFANSLVALTNTVATSGTGQTSTTPVQYVFLMTDGVVDYYNSACTWGHCTGPFTPSWCDAMKAKGITVGVLYTTYLPLNGDGRYDTLVSSFASQIQPQLAGCASNGWFYQASDAAGIQAAIDALFKQATGIGVLTQ